MLYVKVFSLAVLSAALLFGQGRGAQEPTIAPSPQPAQSVTIQLSAELATALEGLRLNTRTSLTNANTGVTTVSPQFQDIKSVLVTLINQKIAMGLLSSDKWATPTIKADKASIAKCSGAGAADCIAAGNAQLNRDIEAALIQAK